MIGDHYQERIPQQYPWILPQQDSNTGTTTNIFSSAVSKEEFNALKKDVQEMKALLIKAKIYDEANGESDCEMEDKIVLLKKIAELVGVDLNEVFGDR